MKENSPVHQLGNFVDRPWGVSEIGGTRYLPQWNRSHNEKRPTTERTWRSSIIWALGSTLMPVRQESSGSLNLCDNAMGWSSRSAAGVGCCATSWLTGGLRVMATDASEAMLNLARAHLSGATELRRLTLPDDPIPLADAIVGVGHALNYLDDESQVDAALVAIATSLRPGGIMAIDLCDLEWGTLPLANRPECGGRMTGC